MPRSLKLILGNMSQYGGSLSEQKDVSITTEEH